MRNIFVLSLCLLGIFLNSCKQSTTEKPEEPIDNLAFIEEELQFADKQLSGLLTKAKAANKNPRTVEKDSSIYFIDSASFDWTEGFFPGTCWYLYEATQDTKWKEAATHFQSLYKDHKDLPAYHDLGFVFNCSYGNGNRITPSDDYKTILIDAANTLANRYDARVGSIKSWDADKGWQADRNWEYPVIIDNMMNLELLYEASILTSDSTFAQIANAHADKTMANHYRSDYSSYHVVDYDSISGEVRKKETAQGFADSSSWARGQAWGLYGFTLCYKYTNDKKYLDMAENIAAYILNSKELPDDKIPYWDYDTPDKTTTPRDVSAAAVTASALIKLNEFTSGKYEQEALEIVKTLATPAYKAELGANKNFLLKHSVGSIPHDNEIDVPLNYADYYYIEALLGLKKYYSKKKQ
mgnify:FL=1